MIQGSPGANPAGTGFAGQFDVLAGMDVSLAQIDINRAGFVLKKPLVRQSASRISHHSVQAHGKISLRGLLAA